MKAGARGTRKGFTFIELLISVAIVSFVGAAVYSVFSNGIRIWRRSSQSRIYERDVRLVLEKFTGELRNALEISAIPFEGSEEFLRFPSLIDTSSQDSYTYRLGRITYFFDDSKKEFCRKQESYSQALEGSSDEDEDGNDDSAGQMSKIKSGADVQGLISSVKELKFSYCYLDNATGEYRWKDDWKKEEQDSTPKAVTVDLSLEKGSGEEVKLSRAIFIPLGTGRQEIILDATTIILDEIKDE